MRKRLEPHLKRRLLVAVIVIALVVIFLPIPFGHLKIHTAASDIQDIPPAPQTPKVHPLTQQQAQAVLKGFTPGDVSSKKATPISASTPKVSLPTVSKLGAKEKHAHKAHETDKAHHKKASSANDGSPVVASLGDSKNPILIRESALDAKMPTLHLRMNNVSSQNASISSKLQKRNIAKAKSADRAWVIQLGSFAELHRAKEVVHRLQHHGYTAFSYKAVVHGQLKHRVYVGPFIQEKQALEKMKTIKARFHLPGYVHRFDASKLH